MQNRKNKLQNPFHNPHKNLPNAILYDLKTFMDSNQRKKPRAMITFENAHVAVLVSISDLLGASPRTSEKLTRGINPQPHEELKRRGGSIPKRVSEEFMRRDFQAVLKKRHTVSKQLCVGLPRETCSREKIPRKSNLRKFTEPPGRDKQKGKSGQRHEQNHVHLDERLSRLHELLWPGDQLGEKGESSRK